MAYSTQEANQTVDRISNFVAELIDYNRFLEERVDDLSTQLERLNTKLSAAQVEINALTQAAEAASSEASAEADKGYQLLLHTQSSLNSLISELNRFLQTPQ